MATRIVTQRSVPGAQIRLWDAAVVRSGHPIVLSEFSGAFQPALSRLLEIGES
jgi:hypothetical protein